MIVLRALWRRGPSTVRQVHEDLEDGRPVGYTTTLKMMQIMADKGLVERDKSDRSHVYRAKLTEERTQRQLIRDLLHRAFGGSARKLFVQALAEAKSSPQEMAEIRRLLESEEGGGK
ncbi:MAG TPA: BlaI/MecI/CopY family transcriptional regulator [Tepidisphaeraceae bacterium]